MFAQIITGEDACVLPLFFFKMNLLEEQEACFVFLEYYGNMYLLQIKILH